MQLLTGGFAVLVVIAGWSISETEKFELGPFADNNEDRGSVLRAVALILFVASFVLAWFKSVKWIYTRHLSSDTDGTILSWKIVRKYMLIISLIIIIITLLVTLG